MVLKSLFTKWVGVHHYAHIVGSCSKSREKSIKGWYCEVWLWEPHLPPFSLCQLGQKQIIRRKCVWDCLVLWLLLLAESVAQTLIQRESCLLQGERTALRAAGMSIASGVLLHWRD